MTTYGPWLTRSDITVTVNYTSPPHPSPRRAQVAPPAGSFADACELDAADVGFGGAFLDSFDSTLAGVGVLLAPGDTVSIYEASQMSLAVAQSPIQSYVTTGGLADYSGPVPPQAINVVYDDGTTTGTTVPQFTVQDATAAATLPLNPTSTTLLHPATGVLNAYSRATFDTWTPGAALSTLTVADSATASGAPDEVASLTLAIAAADWVPEAGFPTFINANFILAMAAQVTHVAPTSGHVSGALSEGWAAYFAPPTTLTVTATVALSRYRFVYDTLPPLRQFPRDDSLGGAPRQGRTNGPTSTQSSTRQGWKNTYR